MTVQFSLSGQLYPRPSSRIGADLCRDFVMDAGPLSYAIPRRSPGEPQGQEAGRADANGRGQFDEWVDPQTMQRFPYLTDQFRGMHRTLSRDPPAILTRSACAPRVARSGLALDDQLGSAVSAPTCGPASLGRNDEVS